MTKFKPFQVELSRKRDDKDEYKDFEAAEDLKSELDIQVASINSELLKLGREHSKLLSEAENCLYARKFNLDGYDKNVMDAEAVQKKINAYKEKLEERKAMIAEMFPVDPRPPLEA